MDIPTSSKRRMGRSSQNPNILAKGSGMDIPSPNKGHSSCSTKSMSVLPQLPKCQTLRLYTSAQPTPSRPKPQHCRVQGRRPRRRRRRRSSGRCSTMTAYGRLVTRNHRAYGRMHSRRCRPRHCRSRRRTLRRWLHSVSVADRAPAVPAPRPPCVRLWPPYREHRRGRRHSRASGVSLHLRATVAL